MNRRFSVIMSIVLALVVGGFGAPRWSTATSNATHTVKRGDTLSAIALKYDVSAASVIRANNLKTARGIRAGQKLSIPNASATTKSQSSALPAHVPARGKAIYVSISKQRMTVYQNGNVVYQWRVSTGVKGKNTKAGNFRVQSKMTMAWSNIWQLKMPYWMGIYNVGRVENGIHALPINKRGVRLWGGVLGTPASFGCVVLSTQNSATLYKWAPMGTPVIIRY
jgi:lipoprotein-anchoring transpeptidase ErfK/SrfK